MFEIKKFDIGSVVVISLIFYLILGVFIAIPFGLIGLIANSLSHSSEFNSFPNYFGVFFIIIIPIFYAIVGTIMSIIMALIYNLIAKKLGGLKIELVKVEPLVNKFAETTTI